MTLRKPLLVFMMAMLVACLAGVSMEDLDTALDQSYVPTVMSFTAMDGSDSLAVVPPTADETAMGDALFIQFLEEDHPLGELELAAAKWQEANPEAYTAWIEAKTSDPASPLKFFYLWFLRQDDPLSRINAARQLIENYPDQVYGYRLMTLGYFENYPLEDYFDEPEAVKEMLNLDMVHFMTYFHNFPDDEYHRLAGVWALNRGGRSDQAGDLLDEAFMAKDPWMVEIDPTRLQPIEEFHDLLFTMAGIIVNQEAQEEWAGTLAEIKAELVPYYFEDALNYERVYELLANDHASLDDYYNRFALVSSLFELERTEELPLYLVDPNDLTDTIAFQDAWINYDPASAREVYFAALQDDGDPLSHYLLNRLADDKSQVIKDARDLIDDYPRGLYGYQLLGETYWKYFTTAAPDDSLRAQWTKWLRKDNGRLRAYSIRFPEDVKAQSAYLLTQIIAGNADRAYKYYLKVLNQVPFSNEIRQVDKIMADAGQFDLLWNSKVAYIDKFIADGMLEGADREMYEVVAYCSALYSNGYYAKVTETVYESPNWMDYEDIQYMMVNSHYQLGEYGEVIDILRMMVDRKTIALEDLRGLEQQPIAAHENWPALMEYAAQLAGIELEPTEPAESTELDGPAESQGFEAYPAPEWILPDPEGNIISLKDLRGQILILDFWATWCGPCRSAMPLINEWMATDMPEGVQVFSINVWEDDKQAVIKFMNDNKYAMHLLFGTEELTSLYGVEGIPFICVIDGEGMVRGVEKGYSPTLKDTLNAWVNEILGR